MPEPEAVFPREDRARGPDQVLADQRHQPRAERRLGPPRARDRRLLRARSPSRSRTLVRLRRAPRARGGRGARRAAREWTAASPPAGASSLVIMASICSTKSGLPSAASVILARTSELSSAPPRRTSSSDSASCSESGSSVIDVAFGLTVNHVGCLSSSSGRARQTTRIGASRLQPDEVLDQVEEGRLGPLEVVEADDQRAIARQVLEQPADGPESLVGSSGDRRRCRSRRQRAPQRGSASSSPSSSSSICSTREVAGSFANDVAKRPVRDSLAVGKAMARRARTLRRATLLSSSLASRDFPMPAGPTTVISRQARSRTASSNAPRSSRELQRSRRPSASRADGRTARRPRGRRSAARLRPRRSSPSASGA